MKIRTTKYIIKEGFINAYRNKLMSLASVGIVSATLIIFGMVFLMLANLNYNLKILKEQHEMVVYCNPDLDDASLTKLENGIRSNNKVESYKRVSQKEAYDKMKNSDNLSQDILDGIDEKVFSVAFIINLKNPEESPALVQEYEKTAGVQEVRSPQKLIFLVTRLTYWMRMLSGFLITALLVVCMFIISNTIRLTVFARRKEINIMKYIGATDWFIRWPFVVEGVIMGIVGAAVAFMIVSYGYSAVESRFNNDLSMLGNIINLITINQIALKIIWVYLLIGTTTGILGSAISLRKHLRV